MGPLAGRGHWRGGAIDGAGLGGGALVQGPRCPLAGHRDGPRRLRVGVSRRGRARPRVPSLRAFLPSLHVWLETCLLGPEDEGSPACPPSADPDLCCLSGRPSGASCREAQVSLMPSGVHARRPAWWPLAGEAQAWNVAVAAESSPGGAAGLDGPLCPPMAATPGSLLPAHFLPTSCPLLGSWLDGTSPTFQGSQPTFLTTLSSLPWFRSFPFSFPALHVLCLSLVCLFSALSWVPGRQGLRLSLTVAPVWTVSG